VGQVLQGPEDAGANVVLQGRFWLMHVRAPRRCR
jgi:hypothetical protein